MSFPKLSKELLMIMIRQEDRLDLLKYYQHRSPKFLKKNLMNMGIISNSIIENDIELFNFLLDFNIGLNIFDLKRIIDADKLEFFIEFNIRFNNSQLVLDNRLSWWITKSLLTYSISSNSVRILSYIFESSIFHSLDFSSFSGFLNENIYSINEETIKVLSTKDILDFEYVNVSTGEILMRLSSTFLPNVVFRISDEH